MVTARPATRKPQAEVDKLGLSTGAAFALT
jgi:hypothetical protein